MKLVVIDCYDSFTYNLVHYLEQMCKGIDCIRSDKVNISELKRYDGIVLSPGPGLPQDTKNLHKIIGEWGSKKPILGICLGHQAIGTFFGLELVNMSQVHHGINRPTSIVDDDEILFKGLPSEFLSARYHSWVLSKPMKNSEIKLTAVDTNGAVMGISHNKNNIKGLQFHPESILTEHGYQLLKNWVESI